MALGSTRLVSLADARVLAQKYRGIARSGGDPFQERRQHHDPALSFKVAAVETYRTLLPTWRNSKHGEQWMNTLCRNVFPVIGDCPVGQVSSADVLRVLTPIWAEKAETARRVSQRIGAVVRRARASGYYTGEDPVEGAKAGLPKGRKPDKHHRSLGYSEIPGLVLAVRHSTAKSMSKFALEFLILGVSRTKEVRGALWHEIDLAEKLWVVSASWMKGADTHRVPLGERMVEILSQTKALSPHLQLVFPNPTTGKPLSENTMLFFCRNGCVSMGPFTGSTRRLSIGPWRPQSFLMRYLRWFSRIP